MKGSETLGILCFVFAGILLGLLIGMWLGDRKIEETWQYCLDEVSMMDQCAIYDGIQYKEKPIANGVYWHNQDYYCVWIKDRTIDQIMSTDVHERCHYLVEQEYDHFCNQMTLDWSEKK